MKKTIIILAMSLICLSAGARKITINAGDILCFDSVITSRPDRIEVRHEVVVRIPKTLTAKRYVFINFAARDYAFRKWAGAVNPKITIDIK